MVCLGWLDHDPTPKGRWFSSQTGHHIPALWVQSPVWVHIGDNCLMFLSHISLSLPLSLSVSLCLSLSVSLSLSLSLSLSPFPINKREKEREGKGRGGEGREGKTIMLQMSHEAAKSVSQLYFFLCHPLLLPSTTSHKCWPSGLPRINILKLNLYQSLLLRYPTCDIN